MILLDATKIVVQQTLEGGTITKTKTVDTWIVTEVHFSVTPGVDSGTFNITTVLSVQKGSIINGAFQAMGQPISLTVNPDGSSVSSDGTLSGQGDISAFASVFDVIDQYLIAANLQKGTVSPTPVVQAQAKVSQDNQSADLAAPESKP